MEFVRQIQFQLIHRHERHVDALYVGILLLQDEDRLFASDIFLREKLPDRLGNQPVVWFFSVFDPLGKVFRQNVLFHICNFDPIITELYSETIFHPVLLQSKIILCTMR